MLRSEIETEFDSFITTEFADKPEEKKFLLRHERRNLVIRNLCKQVTQVFDRGLDPDRETFKVMIADCSRLFCRAALQEFEWRQASQAEKVRRITSKDAHEFAEKMAEELAEKAVVHAAAERQKGNPSRS